METKTCKSCKSDIHQDAIICPQCRTKQKSGIIAKLLKGIGIFMLVIFGLSSVITIFDNSMPKSKEQIVKINRKKELLDQVSAAVRIVKKNLKNPESYKEDKVGITADETVCITYYATNSFNAVIPGIAYARNGVVFTDEVGFKKYCSKPLISPLDLL